MQVNKVNSTNQNAQKQRYINSKATGYISLGGAGLTIATGLMQNQTIKKSHKFISILTALSIALHIFSVEFNKRNFQKTAAK